MTESGTALRLEGLTKNFGSDVRAVDDLSLAVDLGQVWGLLGPNGAGKTTALRMLLGLIRPNTGRSFILGEQMKPGHPVLARVGALVERPAFVPHLSGTRNLKMYWRAGGAAWPPPGLDDALRIAGLGNAIERKTKTYSQGMRQRLGIAQALLAKPEVLVLDEPTNGLDPGEIREVRHLLRDLAHGGVTTLLSSHVLAEIEQVCTHVAVMDHGRLLSAGTVSDLVRSANLVYLEVDDVVRARAVLAAIPGVGDVTDQEPGLVATLDGIGRAALVSALVQAGVGVETVTSRNRLEDAFLGLVSEGEK